MTLELYRSIHVLLLCVMGFVGLTMIFGYIPKRFRGTVYHRSRLLMGLSMVTLPITSSLYYFTGLSSIANKYYAVATNLTSFYILSMLFTMSIIPLLHSSVDFSRLKFKILIGSIVLFPIPVWGVIFTGNQQVIFITHIVANTVLATSIAFQLRCFYSVYKRAVRRLENFGSEEVSRHLGWLLNTVYLFIGLALVGCVGSFASFYPLLLDLLLISYHLYIVIYVSNKYIEYMVDYDRIMPLYNLQDLSVISKGELDLGGIQLSPETAKHIEKQLQMWIDRRGYTQRGITVQLVSQEIFTNRTYLSIYVNRVYNRSFRSWITYLRIEDAKRILSMDDMISVVEVSANVGFSSSTSFVNTFRHIVGELPSKWREENYLVGNVK